MSRYLLVAALTIFAGMSTWIYFLNGALEKKTEALTLSREYLVLCEKRVVNIKEDKDSDAKVTDPADFTVPNRWLLEF